MSNNKVSLTPEIYFREVPKSVDMNIRSELYSTNEFTFAVAVILSAQATDKKVNEITPVLFAVADSPEKMLALGLDDLKQYIRQISFFNNKAKSIIGLATELVKNSNNSPLAGESQKASKAKLDAVGGIKNNNYDTPHRRTIKAPPTPPQGGSYWSFPTKYHNRDALMALPGIGQKTANVIMNVLWGAPMIGVDTHVFRNAHRYGWVGDECNTPEKVEKELLRIIPKQYHQLVNHVMVLHGRYTCKALRPKCDQCPVAKYCPARNS